MFKEVTEKGLGKMEYTDNVLEILEEKHDPTANIRPYLMASFGSAWAVIKVNVLPYGLVRGEQRGRLHVNYKLD